MIEKDIPKVKFAHIGGSGTWAGNYPEDLNNKHVKILKKDMEFETPFCKTVPMKLIEIDGELTIDKQPRQILYIPFHGWHGLSPFNNPSESVFWVLQRAGVEFIIADGSGGGINHLMDPGDIIIPTDFVDMTKRPSMIGKFTNEIVRMRDPLCHKLNDILYENASKEYRRVFKRGTYCTSEAPRFESVAEINMLKQMGCDITGHTLCPEVYLARAIGACYCGIYIISNYAEGIEGNWKGESIFDHYMDCANKMGNIVLNSFAQIPVERECSCMEYIANCPDEINNRIGNE